MKSALVLATALLVQSAWAQPAPTPAPPTDSTPTAPPTPAPAEPPQPPPVAPKDDPAYGERPEHTVNDPGSSDLPGIRRGRDIVVRYTPNRSTKNITTLAALAGGGLVFGVVGLYFHFESRSASDAVAAKTFTGKPWTSDREDDYDRAHSTATLATVMYGIGGALLVTSAIYYMATEPDQVETVIRPHSNAKHALVAPTPGGALVGAGWSF